MKTSAYQKRLEREHKKFIKSIKTTNDVWDKLLVDYFNHKCKLDV